jgi:PPM family protein phosphatase
MAAYEGSVTHVLLDGMGCSEEIARWTQAAAVRLAMQPRAWVMPMPRAVAVVALFRPGALVQIAWCGDGRAYRRGLDGVVHRITNDHNARREALDRGLPDG